MKALLAILKQEKVVQVKPINQLASSSRFKITSNSGIYHCVKQKLSEEVGAMRKKQE